MSIPRSLVVAMALVLFMPMAWADDWQQSLRIQMLEDENCEISYLTGAREFELQGRTSIDARVHCTDKRAFDVHREGEVEKFKLKSCDIQSC